MQQFPAQNQSDVKASAPAQIRSRIMRAVKRRDTTPEMAVRRFLHSRGFRFRVDDRRLPGSPDVVLKKFGTVVFVHGCFWHRHLDCRKASTPKSRAEFWTEKFVRNVARDAANERRLKEAGWEVIVVWECETKTDEAMEGALRRLIEKKYVSKEQEDE